MEITKEGVRQYLDAVKNAVRKGNYTVSVREKNEYLFEDYVLDEEKRENIILGLEVEDFCKAEQNDHPDHADEVLYFFGKEVELLPRFGEDIKAVEIYIKFNKLDNNYVIIVSFHESDYPLRYKFK